METVFTQLDIATSEVIGGGNSFLDLAQCLDRCVQDSRNKLFMCYDIVTGHDQSIRVFGQKPFGNSIGLPHAVTPLELAKILLNYTRVGEARYATKSRLDEGKQKGWTIHKVVSQDGELLVAAYASWV